MFVIFNQQDMFWHITALDVLGATGDVSDANGS
jgi:hypothetical protein